MGRLIKRVAKAILVIVVLGLVGAGGFAYTQTSAYDASMNKVYDVPPMAITASTDPAVIARGEHLSKSLAGCATHDCHGADFGAGRVIEMGPVGTLAAPNITTSMAAYTDGELARLIRHGIKKDGRSVTFMPVMDFAWLPDADVAALVSYLRTVKPVDRANAGSTKMKTLGKILDRQDKLVSDVARRINHDAQVETAPPPSPTKEYGKFVARLCTGCHGEHLAGGRIPGAPSNMAVPLNLTPDATGLAGWTYDDFEHVIQTATRKNGKPLDALMPVEALRNMDDTERHALFAYLQSLPPLPFGNR
jgi:mono/diheme cytochrome c family protein